MDTAKEKNIGESARSFLFTLYLQKKKLVAGILLFTATGVMVRKNLSPKQKT